MYGKMYSLLSLKYCNGETKTLIICSFYCYKRGGSNFGNLQEPNQLVINLIFITNFSSSKSFFSDKSLELVKILRAKSLHITIYNNLFIKLQKTDIIHDFTYTN